MHDFDLFGDVVDRGIGQARGPAPTGNAMCEL
jgi:hypothetical protein